MIFSDFAISACTDDPYRIAVGKTHKSGASNIPPNIHVFLRYQRCITIAFAWCETRFHCSAGPKCVSTILYGWSVHHKPSRIHGKLARMTSDYFANQIRRHSKCFGYARSTPWLQKNHVWGLDFTALPTRNASNDFVRIIRTERQSQNQWKCYLNSQILWNMFLDVSILLHSHLLGCGTRFYCSTGQKCMQAFCTDDPYVLEIIKWS